MLKIGLTGGIATGKSYVLDRFRVRGFACLDADELAHGVMVPGTEATAAIASRFGPDVLAPDGSVDRTKLAPMVFGDSSARRELEAIVHPVVYRAIGAALRAFEALGHRIAVVDVSLLYESGHEKDFDRVIVTSCDSEVQLARLRHRGLTEEQARQRLSAQWPTEQKSSRADFVIQTGGPFEETDKQVEAIVRAIQSQSSI